MAEPHNEEINYLPDFSVEIRNAANETSKRTGEDMGALAAKIAGIFNNDNLASEKTDKLAEATGITAGVASAASIYYLEGVVATAMASQMTEMVQSVEPFTRVVGDAAVILSAATLLLKGREIVEGTAKSGAAVGIWVREHVRDLVTYIKDGNRRTADLNNWMVSEGILTESSLRTRDLADMRKLDK